MVGTLWYIVGWYIVYIVGWYSLYSWLVWYSVYVAAVPTPEDWKWCILYSVGWLVQFVQFVQLVGTVCILPLYLLPNHRIGWYIVLPRIERMPKQSQLATLHNIN